MSLLTGNADGLTLTGCEFTASHQADAPLQKIPGKWLGPTTATGARLTWRTSSAPYASRSSCPPGESRTLSYKYGQVRVVLM